MNIKNRNWFQGLNVQKKLTRAAELIELLLGIQRQRGQAVLQYGLLTVSALQRLPDYYRCGADHDDYQLLPRLRGGRDAAGSLPADDRRAHRTAGKLVDSHFSRFAVPDPKISVYLENRQEGPIRQRI